MDKKNYNHTLLMPQTDFQLKANLKEKDKKFFQFWKEIDLYQVILKERENDPLFILHDGPPYANGQLHIGHALNKILKDIVIRRKTMEGYHCLFIPGWDCHGLPIENKILEKYKKNNEKVLPSKLRIESKEFALSQIEIQKKQFQTMQLLTDFKKIYMTMDNEFITNELNLIKNFAINNLISKELKITYYSPFLKTSLADAEIEYKTIQSDQIFVAFKIKDISDYYLLIMTTTPWSLIANAAVAINSNFSYGIYRIDDKRFIIENNLAKSFFKLLNLQINKIKDININELVNFKYFHPIDKKVICPIVFGDYVNNVEGTGLVHSAPYFGEDDFSLIAKYKEIDYLIMHINDDGCLNEKAGKYANLFFLTANKEIIQDLEKDKVLIHKQKINHEYPHDWRMKKPIIYRATYQWFLNFNNIKNDLEKSISNIKSFPDWGKQRLKEMVMNREFWTLSRQRYWGVPLIFFYDENKNPVFKEEIFDYVINIFKNEDLNIWWEKDTDYFLPKEYRNRNWTKETDIIDVWFDSGSSFLLFGKNQIDLYLEGNDQYRGWFNSSIINSFIFNGESPFKQVISHGFVLDKDMKKMSKSLNNVFSPHNIIDKYGADILRLWVANNDFFSDVTISDTLIEQNINLYKMFRNKIRFILGNLAHYPKNINFKYSELDLLILEKLNNLKIKIDYAYSVYKFNDVIKEMSIFFHNLSNFYLEVSKDILYLHKIDDPKRIAILNVLEQILEFSLLILAPILPVTCEEAYQLWAKENKKVSLHLEKIKTNKEVGKITTTIQDKWKTFFEAKSHIYLLLEQAIQDKKINRFQEAWIQLDKKFENYDFNWKELLLVGKVTFGDGFFVKTFDNKKCSRCWNHFVIEDMQDSQICKRCFYVVFN